MLWVALLPRPAPNTPPPEDGLRRLAMYALQYSPRTAIVEDAVVLEVQASVVLFGGHRALRERIVVDLPELGVERLAWAPTSLAALALARAHKENGVRGALASLLDPLPMDTLSATRPHRTTLSQLGCTTLGDVRRLPRGGISRRFSAGLLTALDQAYGLRPVAHSWIEAQETFRERLELMYRVDTAPALLFGARRLLMLLCAWLAARQSGTTAFVLRWMHDAMRARSADAGGEITVRTAAPMRHLDHLCRLLSEHLAKVQLQAPAGDLELEALDVQPLPEHSASLLPDTVQQGEALTLTLERIAARLGAHRVLRPVVVEDHRLEWQTHWQPAPEPLPKKAARRSRYPQPSFILEQPLRLAVRGDKPLYQGVLQLLAGPHRIEGGWWHRVGGGAGKGTGDGEGEGQPESTAVVVRDYWVAQSPHCGVLWIFQERLARERTAWYLHGAFA